MALSGALTSGAEVRPCGERIGLGGGKGGAVRFEQERDWAIRRRRSSISAGFLALAIKAPARAVAVGLAL